MDNLEALKLAKAIREYCANHVDNDYYNSCEDCVSCTGDNRDFCDLDNHRLPKNWEFKDER